MPVISWPRCAVLAAALLFSACGGGDDEATNPPQRLSEATPATRESCATLATTFTHSSTRITAADVVPSGTLTVAGQPVEEHCRVAGLMHERTGVNGDYAIGFEMRMPTAWNGRFFYQANGGADGRVSPAVGPQSGAGALSNALKMGFVVLSSDAGHGPAQNNPGPGHFGLDPHARLDYGYQAVGKLTPMARSLVQAAYGKAPDRMYIGGCSNGGRHALVAAARYSDQYDGFLAGNPGFNLPKAAVAEAWDTQQFTTIMTPGATTTAFGTTVPDLSTGFTVAERSLVADRIVARCDALDGVTDGMVLDVKACQSAFSLAADVPPCAGARDGTCLTAAQKTAVANVFAGARNTANEILSPSYPYDPGLRYGGWSIWKYSLALTLGATATPYIFTTPPTVATDLPGYMQGFSMDTDAPKILATSGIFTESAMSFMTPPNPTDLATVKHRGAKVIVYHGTADPVFSSNDTAAWYEAVRSANGGDATNFARYFEVPGMNHCAGGAATDQFDMITALVNWVERGIAPDSVTASVRGATSPGGANPDIPASWSPTRTRPLCPYPKVAKPKGIAVNSESADSFSCQ